MTRKERFERGIKLLDAPVPRTLESGYAKASVHPGPARRPDPRTIPAERAHLSDKD